MSATMGSSPGEKQFDRILRAEISAINRRRTALGRPKLPLDSGSGASHKVVDAVGLALSGGGIRSAAVSLGVLQALNHYNVLRNVDYLSTVSGGGYIGASLTAPAILIMTRFRSGSILFRIQSRLAEQF
jgi:hypothetical protein